MNHIHLVTLGVRNMTKALQFYRGLGFQTTEVADSPPIVLFNNGGSRLALFTEKLLLDDISLKLNELEQPKPFTGIVLTYEVDSEDLVDNCLALVSNLGGKIVKAAQPTAWGGYGGYFQDLDGYYWEVVYGDMWSFE